MRLTAEVRQDIEEKRVRFHAASGTENFVDRPPDTNRSCVEQAQSAKEALLVEKREQKAEKSAAAKAANRAAAELENRSVNPPEPVRRRRAFRGLLYRCEMHASKLTTLDYCRRNHRRPECKIVDEAGEPVAEAPPAE